MRTGTPFASASVRSAGVPINWHPLACCGRHNGASQFICLLRIPRLPREQRRVNLKVQGSVTPTGLDALIDDPHCRSRADLAVEAFDVLRVEANAPMRDLHSDTDRLVGAVDQVGSTRNPQAQSVLTQGIIGPRRNRTR